MGLSARWCTGWTSASIRRLAGVSKNSDSSGGPGRYQLSSASGSRNTPRVSKPSRLCMWGCAASAVVALLGTAIGGLSGCTDDKDDYIGLPPLTPARPNRQDAGLVPPDGAVPCQVAADCDDGIECTEDVCVQQTFCQFKPVRARCQDGLFCNGEEWCDPEADCQPGIPPVCNDRDVCTVDACDESLHGCSYEPRDFDSDGEADWHCSGGTDCDDFDATRSTASEELCGDRRDNDCDDLVDEVGCGAAAHDTCEDALELQPGVPAKLPLAGSGFNYALSCSDPGLPDVVATFELQQARDVQVTAHGLTPNGSEELVAVSVRSDCDEIEAELECGGTGFPTRARMRALPPGRYYVVVAQNSRGRAATEVRLEVEVAEPTSIPANTSCEAAQEISGGGRFAGSFVDVQDSTVSACAVPAAVDSGPYQQPDLYYRFTTTEPHDIQLSAVTLSHDPIAVVIASDCSQLMRPLHCAREAPVSFVLHEMPPGTYYVQLESPVSVEADFELDLRLLPPTTAPTGDECAAAEALVVNGQRVTAELRSKLSKVDLSCSLLPTSPDHVFRFPVDEPTDILVTADMGGAAGFVAVQQVCGDVDRERLCQFVSGQQEFRLRNVEVGQYFLVVESADAAEVNVTLTPTELTVPTVVTGNDTCASVTDVTSMGGLFVGDTSKLSDVFSGCGDPGAPDAVYRLTLDRPSPSVKVTVTPGVNFDAMLARYDIGDPTQGDPCTGAAGRPRCIGAGFLDMDVINEPLDPGVYYYIVDGLESHDSGPYEIEFKIE